MTVAKLQLIENKHDRILCSLHKRMFLKKERRLDTAASGAVNSCLHLLLHLQLDKPFMLTSSSLRHLCALGALYGEAPLILDPLYSQHKTSVAKPQRAQNTTQMQFLPATKRAFQDCGHSTSCTPRCG